MTDERIHVDFTQVKEVCPECGGRGGWVVYYGNGDWDGERCDNCYGTGWIGGDDE